MIALKDAKIFISLDNDKEMRGKDTEKNIEEAVRVSHIELLSKYQGKNKETDQGNSHMIIL